MVFFFKAVDQFLGFVDVRHMSTVVPPSPVDHTCPGVGVGIVGVVVQCHSAGGLASSPRTTGKRHT